MEEKIAELTGKLKTLKFVLGKTDEIIAGGNPDALECQELSIANKVKAVNSLKDEIVELKFVKESESEVMEWCDSIEEQLNNADHKRAELWQQLRNREEKERANERAQAINEQLALEKAQNDLQQEREEQDRQKQMEFEKALLDQKLQYQKDLEAMHPDYATAAPGVSVAKLPKLSITKFNGWFETWLSFWGKFKAEIDDQGALADITKFAYLKLENCNLYD